MLPLARLVLVCIAIIQIGKFCDASKITIVKASAVITGPRIETFCSGIVRIYNSTGHMTE
jgi:hypothetical protein